MARVVVDDLILFDMHQVVGLEGDIGAIGDFYIGEEASCAMIDPVNSVLPIIRNPVLKRRDLDNLIIYDKRHHLLLERYKEQNMLLDISAFPVPEFKVSPEVYDYLWPFVRERRFDVRIIPGQKKSGSTIEPLWLKAS